jgi:hypothetical protein
MLDVGEMVGKDDYSHITATTPEPIFTRHPKPTLRYAAKTVNTEKENPQPNSYTQPTTRCGMNRSPSRFVKRLDITRHAKWTDRVTMALVTSFEANRKDYVGNNSSIALCIGGLSVHVTHLKSKSDM